MADRFVWPRRQREPAAPTRVFRESGKPKTLAAPIHGGQGSSTGCAAAGGTGHCPVQAQHCLEEAAPTRVFWESGKPKTLAAPIYGGQGSSAGCAAAGGTGHCPVQAQPARRRQRRQEFSGEFRKTADLGRFNLWRPMVVERIRGSRWNRALPGAGSALPGAGSALPGGGSADRSFPENSGKPQTSAALIYGGRWSSKESAAATGCRPCRPAAGACRLSLPTGGF